MAKKFFAPLSLLLLLNILFFHGCSARQEETPAENACDFESLNAVEPTNRLDFEAGQIEYWDHREPEFRCAGVAVARVTIQPNGLLLPTFFSSPALSYVVQGNGVVGTTMSGCPETFQESGGRYSQRQQRQEREAEGGGRFPDMHQKVEEVRRGEVYAQPSGVSNWWYNDGETPIVIVTLLDITNRENQLDTNPRAFQIAGSSQGRQSRQKGEQPQQERLSGNNIFRGFDPAILAEAFSIDKEVARELHNADDNRGNIIRVRERLHFVSPSQEKRKWRRREMDNGLEETFCTMTLHENIERPSRADAYSPRAGRLSTVNSLTLPILRWIRFSAARGVLYSNGMVLPHWTQNAHSVMYVTGGRAWCQVVDDNGRSVFDGEVRRGQILVIPQGFAVVKRAEQDGFEWISFRTNDNAKATTLAGRTSVMRALPVDVIATGFQVSREEALRIKFNRQETTLTSTKGGGMDTALEA